MNKDIEKIITRHSIRKYQDKQIEKEVLDEILLAGLYAPSAGNNQRSRIVVSQDKDVNLTLGRLSRDLQFKNTPMQTAYVSSEQPSIKDDLKILDGYYGAPTVLTIFVPNHNFPREDVAMIAENIMLASHFVGVGSCYIGRTEHVFKTEYGQTLRKQWGIEDNLLAIGTVILGYVDGVLPKPKPRKENRIIYV